MKKHFIILLILCIAFTSISGNSFAASYKECNHPMFGWGVSTSATKNQQLDTRTQVGGFINRTSDTLNYSTKLAFHFSISASTALATKLEGSLNVDTGVVKGGLAGAINSSFNISGAFSGDFEQSFTCTVRGGYDYTVYAVPYGTKLTVYAVWHSFWVQGEKVSGTIKIPQSYKLDFVNARISNGGGNGGR